MKPLDDSIDKREVTGAWSPPVEDPKDANDPATLLGVREHFSLAEAVRVLSHFDLGVVDRVREFRRGSRRSPKLRVTAESGEYLLKRRAPGRDEVARVALAHELQAHLRRVGFPVAPLIETRAGSSRVEIDGRIYELFRYIESTGYAKTPEAAGAAGDVLGRLHVVTAAMPFVRDAPAGSFHNARNVEAAFDQIPTAVAAVEDDLDVGELARTCRLLRKGYHEAARRTEALGFAGWPRQLVHGDWHPGNVLFRDGSAIAVLDFDSARLEPRVIDVANGLLQFTMLMSTPDDPASWPEGFDGRRIDAFLRRYDDALRANSSDGAGLSVAEQGVLPWLMVEALIAETAMPIAATGSFASIRGSSFLLMVERKVDWIWRRSTKLKRMLAVDS
ncbi:MAG: phosphotransferase [Phycisphaerales bacterium]